MFRFILKEGKFVIFFLRPTKVRPHLFATNEGLNLIQSDFKPLSAFVFLFFFVSA